MNINKMDFKQLRNEVQSLRDELAIMRRKYEDILYNLDDENFSSVFVKEKDNMKAQIKVTAEEISTKVSETELETELESYTLKTQTASALTSLATRSADLSNAVEIANISEATDPTKTYVIRTKNTNNEVISESYYYYNALSENWEKISGDSIYTVFEQTADGFELKGNTIIDGNAVITKNLTLSGNVTWDMDNSPVQTQYSTDNISWHTIQMTDDMYMRMSFDGGTTWSTGTKVVGQDGQDGTDGFDGSDAFVTAQNVFNALTGNGDTQGLFSAFSNNQNKLYINAEYIKTETLKATRLYSTQGDYYAKVYSSFGDFGLYTSNAASSANPTNANCVWGVYNADGLTQAVNFYSYGNNYMGYNGTSKTTFAKGKWDFSNCTNIVWGDNEPSGGSTGGTATAVFG